MKTQGAKPSMTEPISPMPTEESRPDNSEPSVTRSRQRIQLDRSESSRLYEYTSDIMKKRQPPFVRDYEFLQRLSLLAIENNLAKCKDYIQKEENPSTDQLDQLRGLLAQYFTAIRDLEYVRNMRPCNEQDIYPRLLHLGKHLPEMVGSNDTQLQSQQFREIGRDSRTAAGDPIRDLLRSKLPHFLTYSDAEKKLRKREYVSRQPPEGVSPLVDRLARFIVAFVGGIALVGPMLIMSLSPTQTKSVVTVSVAVLVFAVGISLVMRASNTETLVATATYAAVLVVFVGASSSSPT